VAINLMTTMLLGGLWHGAGWGFIIWGGVHGAGLALERLVRLQNLYVSWVVTQFLVTLAWIPFRLHDWTEASTFLSGMFAFDPRLPSGTILFATIFVVPVIVHQFLPLLLPRISNRRLPVYLGAMTGALMLADLTIVSPSKVFLYFSF